MKDIDDENMKVPKRGSSKGSSGNEEVHHQITIDELIDLFPTEYKIPSDITKNTISVITNMATLTVEEDKIMQKSKSPILKKTPKL